MAQTEALSLPFVAHSVPAASTTAITLRSSPPARSRARCRAYSRRRPSEGRPSPQSSGQRGGKEGERERWEEYQYVSRYMLLVTITSLPAIVNSGSLPSPRSHVATAADDDGKRKLERKLCVRRKPPVWIDIHLSTQSCRCTSRAVLG